MADIKPFAGLRYDYAAAGSAKTLITQPYDVIDMAKQDAYYAANPYNIIRLEWGKVSEKDDEKDNRYSRAATDFAAWQKNGIFCRDKQPAFYPYVQEYTISGHTYRRQGFIATLKAAGYEDGQVLPHEETLPGHKEDRYRLMQACLANFSPVFGLYNEESRTIDHAFEQAIAGAAPLVDFTDEEEVRHILWQVSEQSVLEQVCQAMAALKIYIADGHHRYETASCFAADMAAQGKANRNRLLIHLVNLHDPGLTVLPTHRLAKNLEDFSLSAFLQALTDVGFAVLPQENLSDLQQKMTAAPADIATFGLFCQNQYHLLMLDRDDSIIAVTQKGFSAPYQRLDVSIAHSLIFDALCGIGKEQLAANEHITYCREAAEAIERVKCGAYQFTLLLNATSVEELLAVAGQGEKMPQKSTYFYPKVVAGLVINTL
ncbi:MAG: DUF1015 domain-containing protein [Clostridiales bacterium]|nr:DUF1015 domain-containing protein [Clostridiales bacterium]